MPDAPRAAQHPASFRDPAGFVYYDGGEILRQVMPSYREEYDQLIGSGLYEELSRDDLLVAHSEQPPSRASQAGAYRILRPEAVPFISYPYEWSFSQLRDAARVTLEIQQRALVHGMMLRDASAYNIQFVGAKPVLIDTLSFGLYAEGMPWSAYRQFCQHFLGPLLLMARVDVRLSKLLEIHLDGIPLDLVSRLLPRRTWLNWRHLLHIHLHAESLRRHAGTSLKASGKQYQMKRTALQGLVDSLQSAVEALTWTPEGTEWADYPERNSYVENAHADKKRLVAEYLSLIPDPQEVWDLGANTGLFSDVAASVGKRVVSFDVDPAAVERNYLRQRDLGRDARVLPLLLDLTNPSPSIGWANAERSGLRERSRPNVLLALALLHHLAIGNNVPLGRIAEFFADLAPYLIIEFVPKTDRQVQRLLGSREDIFHNYSQYGFESSFQPFFRILKSDRIAESERQVYLMARVRLQ